jgi:hypothetical protein
MGLTVYIFRSDYDSEQNLFHGNRQLCIVNVSGPSHPGEGCPPAMLVPGHLPGTMRVVAVEETGLDQWTEVRPDHSAGPMFGGTFAYTSDGRWRGATPDHGLLEAVPIHDRFEIQTRNDR